LTSPLLASFGNFDLAFVFVALAPLLVIALTFNVWSAERDIGTWDLIRSQPFAPWRVLALKLALRGGLASLAVLALYLAASLILDFAFDRAWLTVGISLVCYLAFWIAVAALVTLCRQASDTNMVVLLGVWLLAAVVGPASVNAVPSARYPLPESMELTVPQRQAYHGAWDEPLEEVMAAFYRSYPEWREAPIPRDRYSNGWYYAMRQRGDDAARDAAERYRQTLLARERWIASASRLFPPALLQRALTATAGTDLAAYLQLPRFRQRLPRAPEAPLPDCLQRQDGRRG